MNLFVSAEAEAIALMPKSPFVAAEGQIEAYKTQWENANKKAYSVLPYKPVAIGGTALPPPQRVMAEAQVQSITNARMLAADDLKATTGIYDSALGAQSNEKSGRAILARESQAQTANFHFQDNLAMAIRYTGRILVDLIPKIYSGPRVLRILGEDGKQEMVKVNQPGEFKGKPAEIALDAGRYDVAVSMGPSYVSRRQESVTAMLELIRADPSISQVAGDLLVEAMDWPGAKPLAKRLRQRLPPEMRPPNEEDQTPPPQVLAQQLAQSRQMIQQMTEELKSLAGQIETNAQDNAAKERIEMTKLHVALVTKLAELESKENLGLLKAEAAAISARLKLTGFTEPAEGMQPQGGMNGY
jgi:hypothetical protein